MVLDHWPLVNAVNISFTQLRIEVHDQGLPQKNDHTTVHINVQRNINRPLFEQNVVNISLPENRPRDSLVATVKATDQDDVSQLTIRDFADLFFFIYANYWH